MLDLVSELEACRAETGLSLDSVSMNRVWVDDVRNPHQVKGRIVETYIQMWLTQCAGVEFEGDLPRNVNGYSVIPRPTGVVVVDQHGEGRDLHEFDYLVRHDGKPVVVQVKSLKLNGIEDKIDDSLRFGREIFEVDDVDMLLFFPAYTNKQSAPARIQGNFPQVRCVDTGYKKKQLLRAVKRFYESRDMAHPFVH